MRRVQIRILIGSPAYREANPQSILSRFLGSPATDAQSIFSTKSAHVQIHRFLGSPAMDPQSVLA